MLLFCCMGGGTSEEPVGDVTLSDNIGGVDEFVFYLPEGYYSNRTEQEEYTALKEDSPFIIEANAVYDVKELYQ